jgi:hypothetical protein
MPRYISLLALQRSLYAMPAGQARFDAYVRLINESNEAGDPLPLSRMNPMGKSHCLALLDDYLALDLDAYLAPVVATILPTH